MHFSVSLPIVDRHVHSHLYSNRNNLLGEFAGFKLMAVQFNLKILKQVKVMWALSEL